jgi:L-lactate dehydrogenase (cytochrome)
VSLSVLQRVRFLTARGAYTISRSIGVVSIRAETGIVQVISSNASCSLEELAEARAPEQTLMWQYYVAADRSVSNDRQVGSIVDRDMN